MDRANPCHQWDFHQRRLMDLPFVVEIGCDFVVWIGLADDLVLALYLWTSSEIAYDNSRLSDDGSQRNPLIDSVGGAAAI